MTALFQFIQPGELHDVQRIIDKINAERFAVTDVVHAALHLADSAAAFFRVLYPVESPYFWWGASLELPWHADYWRTDEDGTGHPKSIQEECYQIAEELSEIAITEGDDESLYPLTDLMAASSQSTVQALAVETMLAVDRFLTHVSGGFVAESVSWLATAYMGIIGCTCESQKILGDAAENARKVVWECIENARKAADVHRREHSELKGSVWRWYSENWHKCPSLD